MKILNRAYLLIILFVVFMPTKCECLPSGLPTLAGAAADATVSFSSGSGIFTYSYVVSNSSGSVGRIHFFDLDITTTSGGVELPFQQLPNSADGFEVEITSFNIEKLGNALISVGIQSNPPNWMVAITANGTLDWVDPSLEGGVAAGTSLDTFNMISPGIPGIRSFLVKSYFDPDDFFPGIDTVSDEEAAKIGEQVQEANRATSVHGFTVGPTSPPSLTDPAKLIDFLASQKQQAFTLGWLGGKEFVEELDEKLDQAREALAKGKGFKARKKLEQFIKKLEDQRKEQMERQHEVSEKGKQEREEHSKDDKRFLTDNAFFLLKPNAQFIISKLPLKPKDREEEKEDEKDDEK